MSSIIDEVTTDFVSIPEGLIETSIYALLHNQSLLIEGAGALGVGALLMDLDGQQIVGKTLVILSGGNISSTQVAKAMSVDIHDSRIRTLLGLRNVRTPSELPQNPPTEFHSQELVSKGAFNDEYDGSLVWKHMISQSIDEIEILKGEVDHHYRYASRIGLRCDSCIPETMHQQFKLAQELADACQDIENLPLWQIRGRYRLLLQQIAMLRCMLQWSSPSYDQSLEKMFFDPAEQHNTGVNYARYGSILLRDFELHLSEALGFHSEKTALLATSSGQAAYQLIESFLLHDVLKYGDCILFSPYIYFEAYEQIRSFSYFRYITCPSYSIDDIIYCAEENDAKVLFLDPMANLPGLPTIDLRELALQVEKRSWRDRWIIVDGTMVSGGVNPFDWFSSKNQPRILYYESGSKYLQMGMDLEMAGVCVAELDLMPRLFRLRRNSGTIMYPAAVARFPSYRREHLLQRMNRLSNNAHRLASTIQKSCSYPDEFLLGFPEQWKRLGWRHAGGIVTLTFGKPGLNNRDKLESLIARILQQCRRIGIPITKGVSFGFWTSRVSAASAMSESTDPFLRFSVGEETDPEMQELSFAIVKSIREFCEQESVK